MTLSATDERILMKKEQITMKTSNSISTDASSRYGQIPQLKIRSGLRGGASLEACEKALADWKRSYYKHYEAAKYKTV